MPRIEPKIKMSIALMLAALTILISGLADATISVKPGQSIQPFINSAHPGQTIEVQNGTYYGRINLTRQLILKGVGNPVVDAGGKGSAITISANGSTLIGFVATGSGVGPKDAGIKVLSKGNIIKGNTAIKNGNIGIFLLYANNNTLAGNNVQNNQNGGIALVHSNGNQIWSNSAKSNKDGFLIETSRSNIIKANNLSGNKIGINISNRNLSESITSKGKGVSIKYRSGDEQTSYNISKMSLGSTPGANLLYQNDLSENDQNAFDDGFNQWDNSEAGNHYGSYDAREEGCKDRNRDEICDSGYNIPGGHSIDQLPKASLDAILQYKSKGSMGSELKIYQRTYQPDEDIDVKYIAPEGFSGWIGVAKAGEGIGQGTALSLQKIGGGGGSTEMKAPAANGSYDLRMYNSIEELASLNFHVGIPGISAAPASVNECEMLTISYYGAPGYENDWIAMYKAGSPDSSYLTRQYLDGNENGTVTMEAPDPGSYDFRIFKNDSYERLATSNSIEVKAMSGNKVIAYPSRVAPGGTVTVTYWGAPPEGTGVIGMYGMTGQDKFPIGMMSIGSKSCGSIQWQLPYDPGQYDFRMFRSAITDVGQGAYQILGQSSVVTVG